MYKIIIIDIKNFWLNHSKSWVGIYFSWKMTVIFGPIIVHCYYDWILMPNFTITRKIHWNSFCLCKKWWSQQKKKESKWEYIHLNVEQGPGLKNFKLVPDKMLWKYNVHFGWYPSNFSAISSTKEGRRMEVILLKISQIKSNPVKSS